MNMKRISLGVLLVTTSLILVLPKENFELFNWGNPVLKLILAVIPAILIFKGLMNLQKKKKVFFERSEEVTVEHSEDYEESDNIEIDEEWSGPGTDVWQGKVQENEFTIREGKESCHFAKKFKNVNLSSIEVKMQIEDEGEAFLEIGTSDSKEGVDRFDPKKCSDSERFELSEGNSRVDLNLDWKKYSFMKIVLHRESKSIKSPVIQEIEIC